MKIRFPQAITPQRAYTLVVEIAAADVRARTKKTASVEIVLVAPGFSVAPNARQMVRHAKRSGPLTCTFTLRAASVSASIAMRDLRADLLINGVLAASATSSTVVVPPPIVARRLPPSKPTRSPDLFVKYRRSRRGALFEGGSGRAPMYESGAVAKKKGGGGGGVSRGIRRAAHRHKARAKISGVTRGGAAVRRGVAAQTVSREPFIEFHELIEAGQTSDLTVRLSDAITQAERSRLIEVEIKAGQETTAVAVRLSAPGFKVKQKPEKVMKIGRLFDDKREQVTFTLTANDPGEQPITREIRADFWLGNNCIGAVTHRTQVIPAGYKGAVQPDGTGRRTPFELKDDRTACDLVVVVSSTREDGAPPYNISLRSRLPGGADYEFRSMGRFDMKPQQLSTTLNGVFAKFTSKYPFNGTKSQLAEWRVNMHDAVETLGKYLWSKLPTKFQDEYFRLYDSKTPPRSIQVHSEEMLIPWELLIPNRTSGKTKVLKPLGMMHVMGRWRPGLGAQPRPQQMRVTSASIVNPDYGAGKELYWSILEAQDLEKAHPVFQPLRSPRRAGFKKLLGRKDLQVIHYTGHGRYTKNQADLSSLELEGGDLIDAIDFVAAKSFSEGKALVYLNACEAGNVGVVMGQMGGFAVQCVNNGSSGVIAPYWSVLDGSARDFSLAFYEKLSKGRSIGEALKELRTAHPKDPTYLAFSYFGDPWTKLQF